MSRPRRILMTGASTGLGAALAARLAAPGVTLLLCSRRQGPLEQTAAVLRAHGAEVIAETVDVTDIAASADWIDRMWHLGPVDLAILNAGIFAGRTPDGRAETPQAAADLIATNMTGAIVPALRLAEHMRQRKAGQLVFISSLAAFGPHADAPSYSASKAGLTAFARALREDLLPDGVKVTIVHPGHIETRQTAQHIGPLPGIIPVERAAELILRAIRNRRSEHAFPFHLRLALAGLGLLPWRWQHRVNKAFRFAVRPPDQGHQRTRSEGSDAP